MSNLCIQKRDQNDNNACICSGFWARDRDKSKLHLMVYSTNPRTSPHTSTKRREGINPIENALKPQLYILIIARYIYCLIF